MSTHQCHHQNSNELCGGPANELNTDVLVNATSLVSAFTINEKFATSVVGVVWAVVVNGPARIKKYPGKKSVKLSHNLNSLMTE